MMPRFANTSGLRALLCALFAVLLCLVPHHGMAGTTAKKVLIINSNDSVQKYLLAQSSFHPRSIAQQVTIDLGSSWTDETKIARRITAEHPDVIYCIGAKAYLLAHKVAGDTPVIFSSVLKWQRLPLGRHTFGIAMELPASMQLTTYRYFFPNIKRVGVLYSRAYSSQWLKATKQQAAQAGITIVARPVNSPSDLSGALKAVLPSVDALWLTPDPDVLASRHAVLNIFRQADAAGKPVFAYSDVFAPFGATLMVSSDIGTMARQASALADAIVSGATIGQRVQYPAGSHITLNTEKVERYRLHLRGGTLQSVNRIIK